MRVVLTPALLWLCLGCLQAAPQTVEITSDLLSVRCDQDAGRFTIGKSAARSVPFFEGVLGPERESVKAKTAPASVFGSGTMLEVTYSNGWTDAILLYPKLPFALCRKTVRNSGTEVLTIERLSAVEGVITLGAPANDLQVLGTGGLARPEKAPGSYAWLAVAEPRTRNGVVLGWLTGERGSGVVFPGVSGDRVRVESRIEYGRMRIQKSQAEALELLAIGYFEDARLGLEEWADAVARIHSVTLPPQPAGYCTWYSRPHGGASDETHLAEQATFTARHLAPFGYSVVQIDDKWQAGISTNGPKRNFTAAATNGPYSKGMKPAADHIRSLGLTPGIWFMPFAGTYYDPFFKDHQDWFVKRLDGTPFETSWGGTCLDMTHAGAREHLRSTVLRMKNDWGYRYFKMDGLWTGTGTKQQYINSSYKDDSLGNAVFKNPDKTNIETYRDGLKLVREAVGREVFILGCCAPQNMRSYAGAFGLVDAMRIGPDNGTEWKTLLRGPQFGSRNYFLHGRVWYNDPDPVYVRPTVPLEHARLICSWVALSGQLTLHSEWLPALPPERLELLKRSAPAHGMLARPVDFFEKDLPSIWLLENTNVTPKQHVVGLFNWEDGEHSFDRSLAELGLKGADTYQAFDFWRNEMLPVVEDRLRVTVAKQACRIVALRAVSPHPQVLSTSRHVTQGAVDILEERWDASSRVLHGRSKVVGEDPYELRLRTGVHPKNAQAQDARKSQVPTSIKVEGELLRILIRPESSGIVEWQVQFD